MNVYQLNVQHPLFARTAMGGRCAILGNRPYDTEIYTRLDLAEARIAELAGQGVKAELAKAKPAADAD